MKTLFCALLLFSSASFAQQASPQTQISQFRTALMMEALMVGSLQEAQMKAYVNGLSQLGWSATRIQADIDRMSRSYFSFLQTKHMNEILPEAKLNVFEQNFSTLQKQLESGQFSEVQMNEQVSLLNEEVAQSPVTKSNLEKMQSLKNSFLVHANTPMVVAPTKSSSDKKPLFESVYFAWGYNRSWHGNTDVKFSTPDGNFTVHNTVGNDRPSPFDFKTYFTPGSFSVPQYNMDVGGMFNKKWGVELKQDHMKLVFDNSRPYEMTGDYNRQVAIPNQNPVADWDQYKLVSFEEAKAKKDASWLNFEHSDGYNYVSLGAIYNQNLYRTKNNALSVDALLGAGGGIIVPKTKVMMHQDKVWNFHGLDNKFHIAGGGVHAEVKLRVTLFNKVFLQAVTRGTYIKVKDALVDGTSSRMEHLQMIPSVQVMGQVGYVHTIKAKKKK